MIPDEMTGAKRLKGYATVVASGPTTIGAKRNLGAQRVRTRYLGFIDSDAYPREGWLERAIVHLAANAEVWVVGGPNVSPPGQPPSQRFVGAAVLSFLVSGPFVYRKVPASTRICEHLPSCNLVVRRDDYLALGGMNEEMFTGEDMDFSGRVRRRGKQILYSPEVLVYHQDRPLRLFLLQRVTFGANVWQMLVRTRKLGYLYQLAPVALFLLLASGPIAAAFPAWTYVYLPVAGLFGTAVVAEALRVSPRSADVPGTALAILIGSLAPAVGTLGGPLGVIPDFRKIYRH